MEQIPKKDNNNFFEMKDIVKIKIELGEINQELIWQRNANRLRALKKRKRELICLIQEIEKK